MKKLILISLIFSLLVFVGCGGRYMATVDTTTPGITTYDGVGMGLLPPPSPKEISEAGMRQRMVDGLNAPMSNVDQGKYLGVVQNIDVCRTASFYIPETSDFVALKPGDYRFFQVRNIPKEIRVTFSGSTQNEIRTVIAKDQVFNNIPVRFGMKIYKE